MFYEEMNEVALVYRMTYYIHLPKHRKVEFFCLQNLLNFAAQKKVKKFIFIPY